MTLLNRRSFVVSGAAGLAMMTALSASWAQDFPTRGIRFICPFPAGGPTDITSRIVAEKLSAVLGQPVTVENIGGAGSVIGTTALHDAAADGYTIGLLTPAITTAPLFQDTISWKASQFTPIGNMADVPLFFAVHPSVKATNMKELIQLSKDNPGTINYGVSGFGVITHLAIEWLNLREGTDFQFIPYQGSAPAIKDLLAGQIQMTYDGGAAVIPHHKEGKMRALAYSGTERYPGLPEVPTMAESGIDDFVISSWFGLFAPPGIPDAAAARLRAALAEAVKDPAVQQRITTAGLTPSQSDAKWLEDAVKSYSETWTKVVKEANIKPN